MDRTLRSSSEGLLALALAALAAGCEEAPRDGGSGAGGTTLVFRHFEVPGGGAPLAALLEEFERAHPGVEVLERVLPSSSDQQHQVYATDLEAGATDFDVLALDVVWVAEFARAGWLLPLGEALPEAERADFLPGPLEAVTFRGAPHAVPWFVDAGLLYYRADLLARHDLAPPETFAQLARTTRIVLAEEPDLLGFLWQGRQYEGLVCFALEVLRAAGGDFLRDGRAALSLPESLRGLAALRELIEEGVSPPLVATLDEEGARRLFGGGRALYMRNWPYAWTLMQQPGSAVRGKIGVAPLPRFDVPAGRRAATLGGWQLGVNAHSRHPAAARELVRFLASEASQRVLAREVGFLPSRRSLYGDPQMLAALPLLAQMAEVVELARPRPVTPYYPRIAQILQIELSAVVAGLRTPREAARRADLQVDHVLDLEAD